MANSDFRSYGTFLEMPNREIGDYTADFPIVSSQVSNESVQRTSYPQFASSASTTFSLTSYASLRPIVTQIQARRHGTMVLEKFEGMKQEDAAFSPQESPL